MPLAARALVRATTVAVAITVLALAAGAASASASVATRFATFNATISGTYAADGTLTDAKCHRYDENENPVALPPMTGRHSERTSFRSVRSSIVGFDDSEGPRHIIAGGKAIPVKATMVRTSDLVSGTEVRGCTPEGGQLPTQCGSKTARFGLTLFATPGRLRISFAFSRDLAPVFPDDPFRCPVADSAQWWGAYGDRGDGVAPLSVAKVFDRRARRIVLHGKLDARPSGANAGEGWQATATETMRWTVTLVRRRR